MEFKTLRQNCPNWQDYTQHTFVHQLINGTLPHQAFLTYLQQDFLFLLQFTRAWGLAVYKSDNLADMRAAQQGINAMLDTEIQLHIHYCASYGIEEKTLQNLPELPETVAYTRYVLDCGLSGTLADLHIALAPCIIGYAEIGQIASKQSVPNNPYQSWIDMYASEEYQAAARAEEAVLNRLISNSSIETQNKYQKIFNTATAMEAAFWQMGLNTAPSPNI